MKRLLIAGIGNIFHGDDAFGVEVARELLKQPPRAGVSVIDFGIRSYDLAYALTEAYDTIVLVDAASRGAAPGTVYLIEPDLARLDELDRNAVDAHTMNPLSVLQMAQTFGEIRGKLFLVGCEPAVLENDSGELGLSKPVSAAVPQAIEMIQSLVAELLAQTPRRLRQF